MTNLHGPLNSGYFGCLCTTQDRIKQLRGRFYRVEWKLERIEQRLSDMNVRLAILRDNLAEQQLNFLILSERIENIKQSYKQKRYDKE